MTPSSSHLDYSGVGRCYLFVPQIQVEAVALVSGPVPSSPEPVCPDPFSLDPSLP